MIDLAFLLRKGNCWGAGDGTNLRGVVLIRDNNSPEQQQTHALGVTPTDTGNTTNIPAYAWIALTIPANAWIALTIPANAVSMSFNYNNIQGDWNNDSLAAAINGTNVLSLPGS